MPLTRPFKETVYARARRDAAFRAALLAEGAQLLLSGELSTAKVILRDYINATIGFETLANAVSIPAKSLMRMFSASGNPQANNLFAVLSYLQEAEGVELKVRAGRPALQAP
jgi:DNA-binding phage protein